MENEEKKVLDKIDKSLILQEEQQQRELFNLIQEDLLSFLRNQINLVVHSSDLKSLVENKLKTRLESEDEEQEELTDGALLKLYEILSTNEVNRSGKILELFKETQKVIIQNNYDEKEKSINPTKINNENDLTVEEIQETKKFLKSLDFVKKLKETEFTLEEEKE